LKNLECKGNLLTGLDLTKNTGLEFLICEDNLLNSINLSGLTSLNLLYCGGNQLTSLDLSTNTSLGSFGYYYYTYALSIANMPSLQKVCVWTIPFPPAGLKTDDNGSPNVYFTTDCSKR
jgi:Leucine-rich repeat (LRR) protein